MAPMINIIIGTIGSRLITTILGFLVLILCTNEIGSDGVGVIYGKIVLGLTIVTMLSNFIGGGALGYLVPRFESSKIITISYIWAFISTIIGTSVLLYFKFLPQEFALHLYLLAFIQSLLSINYNVLVGKENIRQYNLLVVLQSALTVLVVGLLFFLFFKKEVISFIYGLYFGFGIPWIFSIFIIKKYFSEKKPGSYTLVIQQILKYGFYVQVANIVQLLNHRLNYYLIDLFISRPLGSNNKLGLYTTANQLSEGTWLIGKSIATVQYARISNSEDNEYSVKLTLTFFKFTFIVSLLILCLIILLPAVFYQWIFGEDFTGIKPLLYLLAPGILAISSNMIFSHYFAGKGKHYINTLGSIIGLLITVVCGLILIPAYGIAGAAITATSSYIITMIYTLMVFIKTTQINLRWLMMSRNDYEMIVNELGRRFLSKK